MTIANKNKVDAETISTYAAIDLWHVVSEHILYKGIECVSGNHELPISQLLNTALIEYGLKCNATNKLYVDYYLCRSAKQSGEYVVRHGKPYIHIPQEMFDELRKKDADFRHQQTT